MVVTLNSAWTFHSFSIFFKTGHVGAEEGDRERRGVKNTGNPMGGNRFYDLLVLG